MSKTDSSDAITAAARQLVRSSKGCRAARLLAAWIAGEAWCHDGTNQEALRTLFDAAAGGQRAEVLEQLERELEIPF